LPTAQGGLWIVAGGTLVPPAFFFG